MRYLSINWFQRTKEKLVDLPLHHNTEEIRKRIKIVVIDDDEASFPCQLLRDSGYTIEWWDKVDERGLDRLERDQFDIIILDINDIADVTISSKDGLGILERLKYVNPFQIIVAFSGRDYDIEMTSFFKKADNTLKKPVDFIKAKDLIDQIIEEKITIKYFWVSIEHILEQSGVSKKHIGKLEQELITGLKNKKIDYKKISEKILKGIEISAKVISIIKRFLALVGFPTV